MSKKTNVVTADDSLIQYSGLRMPQRQSIKSFMELFAEREEWISADPKRTNKEFYKMKGFTKENFYRKQQVFLKFGGQFI